MIGGYAISRGALRPAENVVSVAEGMTVERLSDRLEVAPTGDVVERLGTAFNTMLDRLEVSVRRLEDFSADASHELRSPVSVIRTTADLALRQSRTPDELRADMQEIQAESVRLSALIEDLLTLARSGAGGAHAPLEQLNLRELLDEVLGQQHRTHPDREIEAFLIADGAVVEANESLLRRLVVILVDNAVRHTPPDARITASLDADAAGPLFSVADTGPGIPGEAIDRVFDRFYRADSARNRNNGGFGLGLAIARWIAEVHNAKIAVQSKVGEGTVFTVRFPQPG